MHDRVGRTRSSPISSRPEPGPGPGLLCPVPPSCHGAIFDNPFVPCGWMGIIPEQANDLTHFCLVVFVLRGTPITLDFGRDDDEFNPTPI